MRRFTQAALLLLGTFTAAPSLAGPESQATPSVGVWQEDATQHHYDQRLLRKWRNQFGDLDSVPVGASTIMDTDQEQIIKISVKGNDFIIKTSGGYSYLHSRESMYTAKRPYIIVNNRDRYAPTRDTFVHYSTSKSQAHATTLNTRNGAFIAFDTYRPRAGDSVVLVLTTTAKQYGSQTVGVYKPDIYSVYPDIPFRTGGTTVQTLWGSDFKPKSNLTYDGRNVTGSLSGNKLTWLSQLVKVPPADEYYLTVVMKLHDSWPNQGGKLPGITNTGQATRTSGMPLSVDGVNCSNAGWGGRSANGCRWSARTHWKGRRGNFVGLGTYVYALSPKEDDWGYVQSFADPAPVGQWFAYVQRVKINTPGVADGQLSYWLCTAAGCQPQYHRENMMWRNTSVDESRITEIWGNIFCGGDSCGTKPYPLSHATLRRMTVTTGLPDLSSLKEEVTSLNYSN